MKTKVVLLGIVAVLLLAIVGGAIWWFMRPQVIVFSDDAKLTLLAVEYGKKHVPPNVKASAPAAASGRPAGRNRPSTFTSSNDTLVVWVKQEYPNDQNSYHSFQYYAYDNAGTACVANYTTHSGNGGGRRNGEIVGVEFSAFPRRQGSFQIGVQENSNNGQELAEKKFKVHNPAHETAANWTPQPTPVTKTDDDLSVTLTKLVAGAAMPYTRNNDNPDDPINKGVQATFHVERNGQAVSNWQPVAVQTFDATGNHITGWVSQNWADQNSLPNGWANGDGTLTYQYGLWPGEPAWRVRLEFSQQSNYADDEVWNIFNIPSQPAKQQDMWNNRGMKTNAPFAERDVNGFNIKVYPVKQFTDNNNNGYMEGGLFVQVNPDVKEGTRMTIKITDDQTNVIQYNDYGTWQNNNMVIHRYALRDVASLTNFNVSIALHKSRFVEFTIKPETAPASAAENQQ
ncbi:MAG TPA: hypothetical protein VN625_02095 [Desulfuromonadaceae bacterium]|nr:hypothetical protein [Desulfuromonadaceae bacterium]